jgi:hypothetical protein
VIDELDVALNGLYPEPEDDAGALRRIRARVMGRSAVRRAWRPYLSVTAAAAVLAVMMIALVQHNGNQGATVAVAQILDNAADAQSRAVDQPVPAGQYRYIVTHALDATYSEKVALLHGTRRETWVPADPAGQWYMLLSDTGERAPLLGTVEQAAGLAVHSDPERLTGRCGAFYPGSADLCTSPGNWQEPTAAFIAGLPRDPRRLYDRLRADTKGHGQDPDQEVLVYVTDALSAGLLPTDLRAALYQALTHLHTLEITESAATLDGHAGTALGITAAGRQQEIVIDPSTGAFIGERARLTEDQDGIPAGTVVGSSSVVYAIVKKPWQRPAS